MIARRIAAAILLCLFAVGMQGCQTTTSAGAVGAERKQLLLVSSEQLDEMAVQSYSKLKTDAAAQGALNTDNAMLQRVRAIAARLAPQTRVFRSDAPGWHWEVNVINSKELNAYCLPGGKIMFYSGLIQTLSLSDDEIAVVMGHEISHALREHSREQVSRAIAAQTAIDVGAAMLGLGEVSSDIAAIAYKSLIATRFSRTDESEADRIGLELMARAGYDPRAGVRLWQKMGKATSTGGMPEFLSTHPTDSSRVQQIEALLPAVMPLYTAARRGG
ncbi:M48 family metallopeptidase [Rhodoferax sp.]|uniref:M48 family metallopeptidase n=1 Tax=Rhodoferax sp. TaxID=50421 RepID=UPI001EC404E5|nr:M48 family metallopeptidase [Rhodoferax sp.]MBT9507033.1 M48 family metallopeptidase [Rhodoferax sp.]